MFQLIRRWGFVGLGAIALAVALAAPSAVAARVHRVSKLAHYPANRAAAAASPGTLASGKSEAGVWAVDGFAGGAGRLVGASAESFAFPLASAPKAHYVTSRPTAACPGSAAAPSATAGNLCVYLTADKRVGSVTIYREIDTGKGASRIGFAVVVTSRARGSVYAFGSWAVRAR